MSERRTGKPRVALLQPFWDFFEGAFDGDLRGDREALLAEIEGLLDVDVCLAEAVDGREAAATAAERVAAAEPDALILAVTMAAPPAFALAALERLPRLPLVVLAAGRRSSYPDDYSHADVTAEGATVGSAQLVSSLHRRQRPHALLAIALDEERAAGRISREVRRATAAGRLRRARIGQVGRPIDGYDCVECDPELLRAQIGAELIEIDPGEVRDAYLEADSQATGPLAREVATAFRLAPGLAGTAGYERTLRMAKALESLDRELDLDAGAMNCHVEEIRFASGPGPGLAPCFALGRETSAGVPWSCAGDVPTAVAMLTAKLLGGAALYHEIEALDRASGEALLANSGEHDLACADPSRDPTLVRNRWWEDDPCPGACACFSPPPGPATLLGFTPHPESRGGFRFVVAEGAFSARCLPETGTANAAFRFAGNEDVVEAWTRWVQTGVNHHGAATPGHIGADVVAVAAHLGIDCAWVSAADPGTGPIVST